MTTIDPTDVPDAVIAQHFPLDGPYDDEHTIAAAQLTAELVRYLNRATRHIDAARYPSTVDRVIGALSDAEYGKQQTYSQLAERLSDGATSSLAYLAQPVQGRTSPRQASLAAGGELDQAAAAARQQSEALSAAQAYTAQLGLNEPDDAL